MALFFSILRDVHFMLSVICECLVEGVRKCERRGRSKKVAVKVAVHDPVMMPTREIRTSWVETWGSSSQENLLKLIIAFS